MTQIFQGLQLVTNQVAAGVSSVSVPAMTGLKYITFTPDAPQTVYAQAQAQSIPLGATLALVPKKPNMSMATYSTGILKDLEKIPQTGATPQEYQNMAFALLSNSAVRFEGTAAIAALPPQGGPDLDDDGGSGATDASFRVPPTQVSLTRTTRPLTRDVALWLLIKRNADAMSWTNYNDAINFLFDCSAPDSNTRSSARWADLLNAAKSLSHRRFLPFTDTDAYRALKVSTEAFVTTFGGIAPSVDDWSANSDAIIAAMEQDSQLRYLAEERLGIKLTGPEIKGIATSYVNPMIPYLKRVISDLNGTGVSEFASNVLGEFQHRKGVNGDGDCGCDSLWLDCLGKTDAEKMNQPPLIELIWSYWMEEGGLVQSMNAVGLRFQNMSTRPNDPLAGLEIDPLRPLNNMLWGFIQDDQHRLTIERRAYEYSHHYGFNLVGRAVPNLRPADNRSRFVEAFHVLMGLCVEFFRQMDDTTVVADGFPILNALREVHLLLSQGAHNQFRDLPTTARIEMMMQQWILGRAEFREFLPRRNMVALPEPWMHSVESMKKLQNWGDGNTFQFWQLATTGEQVLASIRYGNWNMITDANNAANWANFFRPEIQTYIHAYRAVTGVDITSTEPPDPRAPSMHLNRRQRQSQRMPG